MASFGSDFLLFAATAAFLTWQKKVLAAADDGSCLADTTALKNSAFVFVKPHANTPQTQALVKTKLQQSGITILQEADISASDIDTKKLIDQHYYAIASKATILSAKDIPVPKAKFQESFGESWDAVLKEGRACNAMEACQRFQCDSATLNEAWQQSPKVVKFGGGFYCGKVTLQKQTLYVFNAFFMSMRSKFVVGNGIHCYVVEWNPKTLSWSDFRNKVLGPTDPAEAPAGSLRRTILEQYKMLGLDSQPDKGDNGVHASASPFEGLAEKMNWLGLSVRDDAFGKALLDAGVAQQTIHEWSVDPRVTQTDGSLGSIFDALEDLDVDECLAKMVELNELNSNLI